VKLTAAYTKSAVLPAQKPARTLGSYVVAPGNTLSGIAQAQCGKPGDWTGIFNASRNVVKDPNLIYPGEHLTLDCVTGALTTAQTQHAAAIVSSDHEPDGDSDDAPTGNTTGSGVYGHPYYCGDGDGDGWDKPCGGTTAPVSHTVAAPAAHVSTGGMGSMQACIISRESGGNSQITNSTGHYGLYQFSYSTWVGSGGSPSTFGHASVAEQNQVFANAVAARGYSDWTPYDGC
jgi:hypothetical protein